MTPGCTWLQYPPWLYAALWKETAGWSKGTSLKHKNAIWGIICLKLEEEKKVLWVQKLIYFCVIPSLMVYWGGLLFWQKEHQLCPHTFLIYKTDKSKTSDGQYLPTWLAPLQWELNNGILMTNPSPLIWMRIFFLERTDESNQDLHQCFSSKLGFGYRPGFWFHIGLMWW